MGSKQVKCGAILSYILIILNGLYSLFLTPYIIGVLGESAYGVYKTISSFTASLMILDLGLGGTMMRYIAKYRADQETEKIPNFIFMGMIQAGAVCTVSGIVMMILYHFLDAVYANGLTAAELVNAKQLYVFLAAGIIVHIVENLLNGVIAGYNKFIVSNGIKVIRLIVRILAVIVFLGIFRHSVVLVVIDLVCSVLCVAVELFYILFVLKTKVRFTHWDKDVFHESFGYTILLFLTSIVAQANSNLSNVVIGSRLSSSAVTVYSMALLIFGMYEQLSTAISSVMLPTITQTLKEDDRSYSKTLSVVLDAGRIQYLLLGALLVGFTLLGKAFVDVWLGDGFQDVYYLVLILIGPALLELCVNVCLSILRAKNMLGFRTAVITVFTILNLVITVTGISHIGYYSAAIGTAFSFFFGSVVTMGVYYYKKLGINLLGIYRRIFSGIWICLLVSGIATSAVLFVFRDSLCRLISGFIVFCLVYAVTLMGFGLTPQEKNIILSKVRIHKK